MHHAAHGLRQEHAAHRAQVHHGDAATEEMRREQRFTVRDQHRRIGGEESQHDEPEDQHAARQRAERWQSPQASRRQPDAEQNRHLVAAEQPIHRAPDKRGDDLRERGYEQDVTTTLEIVAVDMGEVGAAPQARPPAESWSSR